MGHGVPGSGEIRRGILIKAGGIAPGSFFIGTKVEQKVFQIDIFAIISVGFPTRSPNGKSPKNGVFKPFSGPFNLIGMTGFEPAASCSQSMALIRQKTAWLSHSRGAVGTHLEHFRRRSERKHPVHLPGLPEYENKQKSPWLHHVPR